MYSINYVFFFISIAPVLLTPLLSATGLTPPFKLQPFETGKKHKNHKNQKNHKKHKNHKKSQKSQT